MSTINEALKKAQKQRDTRHRLYGETMSAGKGKSGYFLHLKPALLFFMIIIVFLGFLFYLWPHDRPLRRPERSEFKSGELPDAPMRSERLQPEKTSGLQSSYQKAKRFQKNGDLEEARRYYGETLRMDPGYVDALNNMGVIAMGKGEYSAAEGHFLKAIRLDSHFVEPHYNMACLYAIRGDTKKSLAYLKRALSLDPEVGEWARKDADLEGLRTSPRFQEVLEFRDVK